MVMRQKVFEANNKGLFDVAVGEGNISSGYATELQNARVAVNGEVSKRRGRVFFNSKPFPWSVGSSLGTYDVSNLDDQIIMYGLNNEQTGFSFNLATDESIQYLQLSLDKVGSPSGACHVKIYASTGTVGTDALPTGPALAISTDVFASKLTGSFSLYDFSFEEPLSAVAGDYIFLLEYVGGDVGNHIRIGVDSSSPSNSSSNVVSTNSRGSGWVADATKGVVFNLFKAGPDIISLILFEGDFVDTYEVLAQAHTQVRKYDPATGGFDIIVKSGLTNNKRLSWTMFNGHLVMSNGVDPMFKYGYIQQPLNPTTGVTTSGAKPSRTYYVAIAYKSANGETIGSSETTQVIGVNDLLTVASPISLPGATHYNVYHHTVSGDLKLQTSSPIPIGTDYTETTGTLEDGVSLPSSNTAWYAVDNGDNAPKAKYVFALNSRVWASGIPNNNTRFRGSAVADDDDWTGSSDSVDIDLAGSLARGDQIKGINRLGQSGTLILGLKNHIVTYKVPTVFSDISIDKIVYNSGVMSHRGMDEVGVDNYILETAGLNSLKNEIIVQGLKTKKISDNIKDRLVPILEKVADPDEINSINHKAENEFIVSIPSLSRRYVFNYSIKAWMEDRDVKVNAMVSTPSAELLSAGANGRVYREYRDEDGTDIWADGDNSTNIAFRWDTPWLWMDSIQTKKMFKYFRFKGSGSAGLFDMALYYDFSTVPYKTFYLQSRASYFGESAWDSAYWDFPDINKVLVPMVGMGKAIRFSFMSNHKTDMKIAFYGVSFIPSGIRAND